MHLSAPILDQLISALAGAAPGGTEQRRHERLAVGGTATVLPLSDDEAGARRVRVIDVSADGLALLGSRPMTVGGTFLLQVMTAGGQALSVRCLIRSNTLVADGCYRVGAEYDAMDPSPCLLSIGAKDVD